MATLELAGNEQHAPVQSPERGWLQVLPHLDPKYGGLSAVVPRLAGQLTAQEHVPVQIAAFCSADEDPLAQEQPALTSIWPLSRSAWLKDAALKKRFQAAVAESRGVHIHGLWESSTLVAASAARQAGVPYVLSAHGMLERWALKNKKLKKAVYATLFERKNVQKAACLHALTRAEAQDYRRFGAEGPIAIIPNGVETPQNVSSATFLEAFPQAQGMRLVLFLGRIHYKKGVDLLVEAWAEISGRFPDALLVLAGPDSEGTLAQIQDKVRQSGLQGRVLFTGMLTGSMKWSALAAAECFTLPSHSEGLSVAVLEAMGMGLPLVLSHGCNLPQVAEAGAGWVIPAEVQPLAAALSEELSSSDEQRQCTRDKARALALRDFTWHSVADRMASVYRWVTGGSSPSGVEFFEEGM